MLSTPTTEAGAEHLSLSETTMADTYVLEAYRDEPDSAAAEEEEEDARGPSPPRYEPMYDYLRQRSRMDLRSAQQQRALIASPMIPKPHEHKNNSTRTSIRTSGTPVLPPFYTDREDEPFLVNIREAGTEPPPPPPAAAAEQYTDEDDVPPPSYDHDQNSMTSTYYMHMGSGEGTTGAIHLDDFDIDGTPAEQTEELVRWVVAMLMVSLTVAAIGTALDWGR